MKINVRLNSKDISTAINQVEQYKVDLMAKLELFVSELADIGIRVAQENIKVEYDGDILNFGNFVTFQKDVSTGSEEATCILIAEGQPYIKEWIGGSALVNPLLMAEFGSGNYAIDGWKGSFPSPTAKEHTEKPPWFWKDVDGNTHKSYGNEPSRPLYKATVEMENQIREVAERVFST